MQNVTADHNSILTALLQQAEKAKRGGGSGKGPGSRGGHPWRDAKGNIRYGDKPHQVLPKKGDLAKPASSGIRYGSQPHQVLPRRVGSPATRTVVARHTSSTRVAANRTRAAASKPKTPLSKLQRQHKMLSEMDRAIKTGKDPHGNKLSATNIEKLRFLATSLRTDLKGTSKKEVLPFSAYKDVNGDWRWLVRSSSAFQDRDGETVSLKALEKATQKLSEKGERGDLTIFDWWHTPTVLGKCDFSAVHGKVLIESGVFVNPVLGERISQAIANKEFLPGISLTFAHREPGPAVLPGRVFEEIEIIGRSLLPAESASNIATTVEIINLAANPGQTTKEVILKMDAVKEEKLKKLIGPEVFAAFINGSELAEKSLEMAGLSYKAVVPEPAVIEPVAVAPTPTPVEVAPPVIVAQAAPVIEQPVAAAAIAPEEPDEEVNADEVFESLSNSVADKVLAKWASAQASAPATSSKEVSDALTANTIAMKEVATALTTVQAENISLKARLDALEGIQPAAVRARASQGGGVSLEQLPGHLQDLVRSDKEEQPKDPYAEGAARLTGAPIHPGLMVSPSRAAG